MSEPTTRVTMTLVPRSWGRMVFVGAFDVIAGLIALIWPGVTVLVLALVLGFSLLLSGIGSISVGIRKKNGWIVALGIIAVLASVLLFIHPGAGIWAIILSTSFYFFLTGIADLMLAFSGAPGRTWLGIIGVLSVISSIILIVHPGVAIVTLALVAGISFLVRGFGEIWAGLQLRKLVAAGS